MNEYNNLSKEDFNSLDVAKRNGLFSDEEFQRMVEMVDGLRPHLLGDHSFPVVATGGNMLQESNMLTLDNVRLADRISIDESIEFHVACFVLCER